MHSLCEGVDLVDTEVLGADEIPQLLLSRGSLDNPQNRVRDFLSISGRGGKGRADLRGDFFDGAVRIAGNAVCNFIQLDAGETQSYTLVLLPTTSGVETLRGWTTSSYLAGGASQTVAVSVPR